MLAREDFIDGCGGEEPGGKGLFAGAGAGGGEQFKERGAAEEIEIAGVWVCGVKETVAGFAFACPAVFKAVEAALVEIDGADVGAKPAEELVVEDR